MNLSEILIDLAPLLILKNAVEPHGLFVDEELAVIVKTGAAEDVPVFTGCSDTFNHESCPVLVPEDCLVATVPHAVIPVQVTAFPEYVYSSVFIPEAQISISSAVNPGSDAAVTDHAVPAVSSEPEPQATLQPAPPVYSNIRPTIELLA